MAIGLPIGPANRARSIESDRQPVANPPESQMPGRLVHGGCHGPGKLFRRVVRSGDFDGWTHPNLRRAANRRAEVSESYFRGFGIPPRVGISAGWYDTSATVLLAGLQNKVFTQISRR